MRYIVEFADGTRLEALSMEELADRLTAGRVAPSDTVIDESGARSRVEDILRGTRSHEPTSRVDPFGIIQCPLEADLDADEGALPSELDDSASIEAPPVILPPSGAWSSYGSPWRTTAGDGGTSTAAIVAVCAVCFIGCCGFLAIVPSLDRLLRQAASASPNMSYSRIKQLATAVRMYEDDNDGHFPPTMRSSAAVMPYVRQYLPSLPSEALDESPRSTVLGNGALAGVDAALVENPRQTVMFYEVGDSPSGTRLVAYVDGTVNRVPNFNAGLELERTRVRAPSAAHRE